MTQQQKLKEVVEATGGCWHETGGYVNPGIGEWTCRKCSEHGYGCGENPSPSDLNALFDLAEKLGYPMIESKPYMFDGASFLAKIRSRPSLNAICETGDTRTEALLNALHEAVKK